MDALRNLSSSSRPMSVLGSVVASVKNISLVKKVTAVALVILAAVIAYRSLQKRASEGTEGGGITMGVKGDLFVQQRVGLAKNGQGEPVYSERQRVPDFRVSWNVPWNGYAPPVYTDPSVIKACAENNGADPATPPSFETLQKRLSKAGYETDVRVDKRGYPLNPNGRTGLEGRGLYRHWGPNLEMSTLIGRQNLRTGLFEIAMIRDTDSRTWEMPSGKWNWEDIANSEALQKIFEEAACSVTEKMELAEKIAKVKRRIEGQLGDVYEGPVDDPRATDNAWPVTKVFIALLSDRDADSVQLEHKGSKDGETKGARWMPVNKENLQGLFASHSKIVQLALSGFMRMYGEQMSGMKNYAEIQRLALAPEVKTGPV